MDTEGKTPVQITQELLADYASRKELLVEMTGNGLLFKDTAMQQTDELIARLKDELSLYGDASNASVDRTDEYHQLVKVLRLEMDKGDDQKIMKSFKETELKLLEKAKQLKTEPALPQTLIDILESIQNSGYLSALSSN
ncbi:MAG TPA: hypothetical protein VK628_06650 [Flavitalea sp.]|nr:hypothetical protein [Flavitalea sp.]